MKRCRTILIGNRHTIIAVIPYYRELDSNTPDTYDHLDTSILAAIKTIFPNSRFYENTLAYNVQNWQRTQLKLKIRHRRLSQMNFIVYWDIFATQKEQESLPATLYFHTRQNLDKEFGTLAIAHFGP